MNIRFANTHSLFHLIFLDSLTEIEHSMGSKKLIKAANFMKIVCWLLLMINVMT